MRALHFYVDRAANTFVQGFESANVLQPGAVQVAKDDKIQFVLHNAVKNTAVPATVPYVEKPLDFDGIRASIGRRGAAPNRGTFKLRVDGQTTALLTWPADLSTSALIATWKLQVLNALKALSNVGADGVRADDPTGTTGNWFYFTWTDVEREDVIELVENRLLPVTQFEQSGSLTPEGYTQILSLEQFPIAMTTDFSRAMPPAVTVIETRPGGSGVNAEQTVVVPSAATGSVAFVRAGSQTKTMAVQAMTSSSLQAALNEVVADGDFRGGGSGFTRGEALCGAFHRAGCGRGAGAPGRGDGGSGDGDVCDGRDRSLGA